jgi:hypothetical protein
VAVAPGEWLSLMDAEYLAGFVPAGGSAVKFVVGCPDRLVAVADRLAGLADRYGLLYVPIDAAASRLHMIQDVFFAVARRVDWEAAAQRLVEGMFERQAYRWPDPGYAVPIHQVAAANGVDVTLLRREFRQWLTAEIMQDHRMAQDFRVAMTQLCLSRLAPPGGARPEVWRPEDRGSEVRRPEGRRPDDGQAGGPLADEGQSAVVEPVLEWLCGDLRTLGVLRQYQINARITRHNARAMLSSLCWWLRLCGTAGIVCVLDIRQLARAGAAAGDALRYSPAAVMDAFEVLRQVIDDAESFAGLFLAVLADDAFVEGDPKRSIEAYAALKMRIWPDVHARGRDNPLAPLVRLGAGGHAGA